MKRLFVGVAALLALSACEDAMTSPARLSEQAASVEAVSATPLSEIALVSDASWNGGNYVVVGEIKTSVGKATAFGKTPTVEDAQQKLRIEAAELGADAVINALITDVKVCALSWGCRNVTGTAVKRPE